MSETVTRLRNAGRLPVGKLVLTIYRERLTIAGRVLLFGLVGSLVLEFNYSQPLYLTWCGALALLIIAVEASFFFRRDVRGTRELPKHVCAGERIRYEVRLHNHSKRRARDLEIEESELPPEVVPLPPWPALVKSIPGHDEGSATLALECKKRGVYKLPGLAISSSFPSGLFKNRTRDRAERQLLVYPAFKRLADFALPAGRRYQPGGLAMTSDVGDSTEFLCTRDYRYGDSLKNLHWASWARTGKPVVKEFQEEYFVRLAILLDSQVADRDDRAFEAGVSLAASVADALSRKDYIIDIFAVGEQIYRFQAGRALAHFDNILEILACIASSPEVDMAAVLRALQPEAGRLSGLVCILMDWDEERQALVRSLAMMGVAVRTVIVKATAPSRPVTAEPNLSWYRPEQLREAFA